MMDKYKIERVDKWTCPTETGIPLITMPNVPRPLHRLNPRNIMGASTWNHVRKRCYYNANYKCEICGVDFADIKPRYAAHELYSYDYKEGTGKFERCIAICAVCHNAIHSGRLITMYKNGNQLYPKQYVLKVVEHCFSLVSKYNAEHRNKKPLKVYATFLEYLKVPELHDEMKALMARLRACQPRTPEYIATQKEIDALNNSGKYRLIIKRRDLSFMQYLYNTGRTYWRKEELGIQLSQEEMAEQDLHFINKVMALGYLLTKHKNAGQPYAIFCMETEQSDEGTHLGGFDQVVQETADNDRLRIFASDVTVVVLNGILDTLMNHN